jgi:hypothetical protein
LAIAEVGWTARGQRELADFTRRLEGHERRLELLAVHQGP